MCKRSFVPTLILFIHTAAIDRFNEKIFTLCAKFSAHLDEAVRCCIRGLRTKAQSSRAPMSEEPTSEITHEESCDARASSSIRRRVRHRAKQQLSARHPGAGAPGRTRNVRP